MNTAYIFSCTSLCRVNVTLGDKEERIMMTGSHTVADIFCVRCGSIVGWKYVRPLWCKYEIHIFDLFSSNCLM